MKVIKTYSLKSIDDIAVFDTSVCTTNIGDEIIMESVLRELHNIFSDKFVYRLPTHEYIRHDSYKLYNRAKYSFVGGTNLLSSNMNSYNQWKINLIDTLHIRDAILMGVGWWQYQDKPNLYTKILLNRILSKNYNHSVRDEYTKSQLNKIGINNVINTSCPTMWALKPDHHKHIAKKKADSVIFTLTDYNKKPEIDIEMVSCLKRKYQKLYFWPQGSGDLKYLSDLNISNEDIEILQPSLRSFDQIVENSHIDYVGTRLHAGIRALHMNKRIIIIGVDNRAKEKAKDFDIPVIERNNIIELESTIGSSFETRINIPYKNIECWKKQFVV